jgi:hypothetical protein
MPTCQIRVDRRHPHARRLSQRAQTAGGGVPVHAGAAGVEQDRTSGPVADRLVEGSADRRRKGHQDGLASFPEDAQDAVAVLFAEVGDVEPGGFEDPQAE